MEKESLTRKLAQFVNSISYEGLPEDVAITAKRLLLDSLGNAVTGHGTRTAELALDLARGHTGKSTILTYKLGAPLAEAAFVNAALIDATSQEDCLFSSHPGSIVVPVAIGLAEQEGRSGSELIAAMVAGYEIMGRVYLGASDITLKFRGTPVLGVFGAAAAAGKLLGLDEDRMTAALGYAANFAFGLNECWIAGTMEGHLHAGAAAMSGILAANLARAGATAAESALEGRWGFFRAFAGSTGDADAATADLGKRYLMQEVSYKPYPVCGTQQIPIFIMLKLMKQHDIKAEDVAEIVEKVPARELNVPGSNNPGPFGNAAQTLMSSQFIAAATLSGRPVQSCDFYESSYQDPALLALAKKVRLIGEEDRKIPEITIVLKDGGTFSLEEGKEKGTLVPTEEHINAKFFELAVPSLGKKRAKELIEFVMGLEKMTDIGELTRRLIPSKP